MTSQSCVAAKRVIQAHHGGASRASGLEGTRQHLTFASKSPSCRHHWHHRVRHLRSDINTSSLKCYLNKITIVLCCFVYVSGAAKPLRFLSSFSTILFKTIQRRTSATSSAHNLVASPPCPSPTELRTNATKKLAVLSASRSDWKVRL